MKPKEFMKKWKEGILNLPIEKQLKGKIIGIIGGMIGLTLALITMVMKKQWGFSIFVFFIIWIQFFSYIGMRQQYLNTKEMLNGLNTKQQDIESPKLDKELGNH